MTDPDDDAARWAAREGARPTADDVARWSQSSAKGRVPRRVMPMRDDAFTLDWHDLAEGCLMNDSAHALAAWADLRRMVPEQRDSE